VLNIATVGYGDICPAKNLSVLGKTFIVGLSLTGLGFFCGPIVELASSWQTHVPGGIVALLSFTIALGVLLFTSLENMNQLEAAYFSVITGTTIGYGDLSPSSDLGKIAVAMYAIVMINVVGGLLQPAKIFFINLCNTEEEPAPAIRQKKD
jgi:hypothetical protein